MKCFSFHIVVVCDSNVMLCPPVPAVDEISTSRLHPVMFSLTHIQSLLNIAHEHVHAFPVEMHPAHHYPYRKPEQFYT